MTTNTYEKLINFSSEELSILIVYARQYLSEFKSKPKDNIKIFDLGVKLSSLSYYVSNLKSLYNPVFPPSISESSIRKYFEGIEKDFPNIFKYMIDEYDEYLLSLGLKDIYLLCKELGDYAYAQKYNIINEW